jgi:hypothetical protein
MYSEVCCVCVRVVCSVCVCVCVCVCVRVFVFVCVWLYLVIHQRNFGVPRKAADACRRHRGRGSGTGNHLRLLLLDVRVCYLVFFPLLKVIMIVSSDVYDCYMIARIIKLCT